MYALVSSVLESPSSGRNNSIKIELRRASNKIRVERINYKLRIIVSAVERKSIIKSTRVHPFRGVRFISTVGKIKNSSKASPWPLQSLAITFRDFTFYFSSGRRRIFDFIAKTAAIERNSDYPLVHLPLVRRCLYMHRHEIYRTVYILAG